MQRQTPLKAPLGLLICSLCLISAAKAGTPQPSIEFVSLNNTGCAPFETGITWRSTNPAALSGFRVFTEVFVDGVLYMDEYIPLSIPSGTNERTWSFYNADNRGQQAAPFPLPPDQPLALRVGFVDPTEQRVVDAIHVTLDRCNGGTVQTSGKYRGAYKAEPKDPSIYFESVLSTGCTQDAIRTRHHFLSSRARGAIRPSTEAFVDSAVYMDELFLTSLSQGVDTRSWGFYNENNRGLQTRTFPLPGGRPVVLRVGLQDSDLQTTIDSYRLVLSQCDGGTVLSETSFSGDYDETPSDPRIEFDELDTIGCAVGETRINWRSLAALDYLGYRMSTTVKVDGRVYMDEFFVRNVPAGEQTVPLWGMFDVNSRGFRTARFPLPPGRPVTMQVNIVDEAGKYAVDGIEIDFDRCDGGSVQAVRKVVGPNAWIFANRFETEGAGGGGGEPASGASNH